MHIKSKVFIQTLQKSHARHQISFAFEFNNKNTKKVFGANLPPPPYNKLAATFHRDLKKIIKNAYINRIPEMEM